MIENLTEAERQMHRKLAVDLFNHVWSLLDKPSRTREEEDEMLHAAHASRYHWGQVGEAVNFARGEWQVSRVYAVLNRPEPALFHALRSLDICVEHKIGDFDLAFAYEAVARACAIAGDNKRALEYIALGRAAGEKIAAEDDRKLFFGDLGSVPGANGG
jgi:hypothetical protein